MINNIDKLARALHKMGDTHTLSDVLKEIEIGKKQSFVINDSWAITRIVDYPRFRVVEIWLVVGEKKDIDLLEQAVVSYAREVGARELRTYGRVGWGDEFAESFNWQKMMPLVLYRKEL